MKEDGRGGGAWVASLVKRLTLGFGSGCDLMSRGIKPPHWAPHSAWSQLEDSFPLPLPALALSLSLK